MVVLGAVDDPYIGDSVEGYYASEKAAWDLKQDPVWVHQIRETNRLIQHINKELTHEGPH